MPFHYYTGLTSVPSFSLRPQRLFFDVVFNSVRLFIEFKDPASATAVGSTTSSHVSSSVQALEFLFQFDKGLSPDLATLRKQMDVDFAVLLNRYHPIPFQPVSIKRTDGTVLQGEIHLPSSDPSSKPTSTILYLHGGGYAAGSAATYRTFLAELATRSNSQVLAVDYRLAPEHPLPAAVFDGVLAFEFLVKEWGIPPSKIVIGGDSAGGGLTALTLLSLRDQGKPLPSAGFLISPWTDMTCTSETIRSKANEDLIIKTDLRSHAALVTGTDIEDKEDKRRSPALSSLFADFKGLPPLLFEVGSSEILLDDSRVFAKKAHTQGVDVKYREWQRMQHVWPVLFHTIPEGDLALNEIVSFVKESVEIFLK
jgi:monoterpene epsilon-lactone hydrolase